MSLFFSSSILPAAKLRIYVHKFRKFKEVFDRNHSYWFLTHVQLSRNVFALNSKSRFLTTIYDACETKRTTIENQRFFPVDIF